MVLILTQNLNLYQIITFKIIINEFRYNSSSKNQQTHTQSQTRSNQTTHRYYSKTWNSIKQPQINQYQQLITFEFQHDELEIGSKKYKLQQKKINHNQMPDIIVSNNFSIPSNTSRPHQAFSSRINNLMSQNAIVNSSRSINRPLIKFSYNSSLNKVYPNPSTSSIGNTITFNPFPNQNQTSIRYASQNHDNKKYMNVIQHSLKHSSSQLSKFSKQNRPIVPYNAYNPETSYKNISQQFHKPTVIKLGKKSNITNSEGIKFKQRDSQPEYIYKQNQAKVQIMPDQKYENKQNISKLQIQKSEYIPIQNISHQYIEDILPQTFSGEKNNPNNYKLNINIRQNQKSYEERVDLNDLNENDDETHQSQSVKKEENILNTNLLLQKHKANIMPEIQQQFDDLKISNLSKRIQKINNRAYLSQEGTLSQLKSIQKKNNFKQSIVQTKNSRQNQKNQSQNQNTPYKQMNFESRVNHNPQIIQQISTLKQKLKEKESQNNLLKEKILNLQIKNKIADNQEDLRMSLKINEIQIKKLSNFLRMYRLKQKEFQLKEKKYQLNINELQKALSEKKYKF